MALGGSKPPAVGGYTTVAFAMCAVSEDINGATDTSHVMVLLRTFEKTGPQTCSCSDASRYIGRTYIRTRLIQCE